MKIASILLLIFVSLNAFATCTRTGAVTISVNLNNVLVQRDAPIGSVIAETQNSAPSGIGLMSCSGGGQSHYLMQYGTAVAGFAHVYTTNLPGVGISVRDSGNVWMDNPPTTLNWGNQAVNSGRSYHVTLTKIGDITPGLLTVGTLGIGYVESNQSNIYTTVNLTGGRVDVAACSVDTPVVNVDLGNYLTSEFTAVNHTTVSKPVPVRLDCTAGARINAMITAEADTATTQQGAIKVNAGTGTASGVAVQMLDKNNVPVKLNQKFLVDTTTTAGQFEFNWSARYLQTLSTVMPGDANATATLALTYE